MADQPLILRLHAKKIDAPDATPGSSADLYAFSRERIQRNLYRIPLP